MSKIATFSNGHTDTYKGKRDVKAAWMVILPDGGILSGHSLDRRRAESTARNAAGSFNYLPIPRVMHSGSTAFYTRLAQDHGCRGINEYRAKIAAERATYVQACTIEVIDL